MAWFKLVSLLAMCKLAEGEKLKAADKTAVENLHKAYRCLHGLSATATKYDETVAGKADEAAKRVLKVVDLPATKGTIQKSTDAQLSLGVGKGTCSESIYWGKTAVAKVPEEWYAEICATSPLGCQQVNTAKTEHYTNMVWKSWTTYGCAKATSTDAVKKVILVCHYCSTPGNVAGQFATQVTPPTKTVTECAAQGAKADQLTAATKCAWKANSVATCAAATSSFAPATTAAATTAAPIATTKYATPSSAAVAPASTASSSVTPASAGVTASTEFVIGGMDYNGLMSNAQVRSLVTEAVKTSIAGSLGLDVAKVGSITFAPGSVVLTAVLNGVAQAQLRAQEAALAAAFLQRLRAVPNINAVLNGPLTVTPRDAQPQLPLQPQLPVVAPVPVLVTGSMPQDLNRAQVTAASGQADGLLSQVLSPAVSFAVASFAVVLAAMAYAAAVRRQPIPATAAEVHE